MWRSVVLSRKFPAKTVFSEIAWLSGPRMVALIRMPFSTSLPRSVTLPVTANMAPPSNELSENQ